jgi:hypothetical protein
MSDRAARSRSSYTETYFFLRLLWVALRLFLAIFGVGLMIIVFSELPPSSSDKPRSAWLNRLEAVYGAIWNVSKPLVAAALNAIDGKATDASVGPIRAGCKIDVRTGANNEPGESDVGDLFNPTNPGGEWQIMTDKKRGTTVWVRMADVKAMQNKSGCGQR